MWFYQLVWIQPCGVELCAQNLNWWESAQSLTSIRFNRISTRFHFRQPLIFDPLQQSFCGRNTASIPRKARQQQGFPVSVNLLGILHNRRSAEYSKNFGVCKGRKSELTTSGSNGKPLPSGRHFPTLNRIVSQLPNQFHLNLAPTQG